MKLQKKYFFLLIFLLFAGFCIIVENKTDYSEIRTVEYKFSASQNENYAICLDNILKTKNHISIKLNDNFFINLHDLKETIITQKFNMDSICVQLNNYLHKQIIAVSSPVKPTWRYDPLLLLNSLGSGECGDFSFLFSYLANLSGYSSYMIAYSNHQINVLKSEKKIFFTDPFFRIVFPSNNGYFPDDTIHFSAYTRLFSYSYYNFFNNEAFIYSKTSVPSTRNFFIDMPAGSRLIFPSVPEEKAAGNEWNMAWACLKIPHSYTGPINTMLVPWSVCGKCRVKVNSKTFSIPLQSEELRNYFMNAEVFPSSIYIMKSETDINIYYLINPLYAAFKDENVLKVSSYYKNAVNFSIIKTPDKIEVLDLNNFDFLMPEIFNNVKEFEESPLFTSRIRINNAVDFTSFCIEKKIIPVDSVKSFFVKTISICSNSVIILPRTFHYKELIAYATLILNTEKNKTDALFRIQN